MALSLGASTLTMRPSIFDPPHSLCVAARLHDSKRFWTAPVPEVQLVVGGNEEQLSGRVEGQRGDGHVALCKPTLTPAL